MRTHLAAFSALALLAAMPAAAQNTEAQAIETGRQFMTMAAQSDMAEILTSRMALERASAPIVKNFAAQMVEQHGRTTQQLESIGRELDLTPPTELDAEHQQMVQQLTAYTGANFDAAYMQGQVMAHQRAANLYQAFAMNGDQPALRQFAQNNLPTILSHLQMAQEIQQSMPLAGAAGQSGSPTTGTGTTMPAQ